MTYVVETLVLGELTQEEVTAVRMPRARFMEVVEGVLESFPDLRDELLPVAQSMPRFPMNTWVDPTRGCGCVVGEYLVATSEMDRAALARESSRGEAQERIREMLFANPNGSELIQFGSDVDERLRDELEEHDTYCADVIVIEDEQEDATNV
jgi:hypothetical protein